MSNSADLIIERQIELLQAMSIQGPLNEKQVRSLEVLVRTKMMLERVDFGGVEDPITTTSLEDLKALLNGTSVALEAPESDDA